MARMNPDERRAAILAATVAVIARRGIAAATVRDVAAELDISSGLIHHYYSSMDELLADAFAQVAGQDFEEMAAAIDAVQGTVAKIAAFIATYDRADDTAEGGMQMWLDAWAEAARRPALQKVSRALNVQWQELLTALIERGVAEGVITCPDPVGAAWRILSVLDGLSLQSVAHGNVVSRLDAAEWSRLAVERELGLRTGALSQQ